MTRTFTLAADGSGTKKRRRKKRSSVRNVDLGTIWRKERTAITFPPPILFFLCDFFAPERYADGLILSHFGTHSLSARSSAQASGLKATVRQMIMWPHKAGTCQVPT